MAFAYEVIILAPSTQEPQAHIDFAARSIATCKISGLSETNIYGMSYFSLS